MDWKRTVTSSAAPIAPKKKACISYKTACSLASEKSDVFSETSPRAVKRRDIDFWSAKRGFAMDLMSSAFDNNGAIPARYTCDGENISPPLRWVGVPPEAESLVLICDDPDAPSGTWSHWVLYNLAPQMEGLEEDVPEER